MEIVLAVLLLFGGFALGSATADKHDDVEQSSMMVSPTQDNAGSLLDTQETRECLSDKSGIYRDLTVPFTLQIDQAAPKVSTCEGECPDE